MPALERLTHAGLPLAAASVVTWLVLLAVGLHLLALGFSTGSSTYPAVAPTRRSESASLLFASGFILAAVVRAAWFLLAP